MLFLEKPWKTNILLFYIPFYLFQVFLSSYSLLLTIFLHPSRTSIFLRRPKSCQFWPFIFFCLIFVKIYLSLTVCQMYNKTCIWHMFLLCNRSIVLNVSSRDRSLIPGSGRSPGGGDGSLFQYCCRENPMHRGATVHMVQRIVHYWAFEHTTQFVQDLKIS